MNTPLISVLLPAYNVERYLSDCLDSILSQTERRIELIVVDDGSTDGTPEILRRYAAEDARIRVIRQENAGAYVARNRLLNEAKGEWIYLCDADDKLAPGAFERLLGVAASEGLDAVFFNAGVIYESAELEETYARFKNRYTFLNDFSSPRSGETFFCDCMDVREWKSLVWLMLLKRDLLEKNNIRFAEEKVHKDDIFGLDVVLRAQKVARLSDALYFRRMREGSLMTSFHPLEDFLSYAHNALWVIERSRDGNLAPRTRAALAKITQWMFRNASIALANMDAADKERLASEYPPENVLSRILSKTRTDRDVRREVAKCVRCEVAKIRKSWTFRIGAAILAIPRLLIPHSLLEGKREK